MAWAHGGAAGSSQNFTIYETGMRSAIAKISAAGRRVVVLAEPPPSKNLEECVTRLSKPSDCSRAIDGLWRRVRIADTSVATATGTTYVRATVEGVWQQSTITVTSGKQIPKCYDPDTGTYYPCDTGM